MSDSTTDVVQTRNDRLQALSTAVEEYVNAEKQRIDQEVSILQDVLNGRTGGQGIQRFAVDVADSVAQNDLAYYLAEP